MSQPDFSGLKHQDVEVLSIEICFSTSGEIIEQHLDKLSDKVGVPLQIISDHGGDIKKGIELFVQKYPKIIYTYDVTHYMALLFQKELETDDKYQSFLKHCSQTRLQIQQTKLNLLIPPPQRAKSRYFNVEELINWAERTLNYQNQENFSNITPIFRLEALAYSQLKGGVDKKILAVKKPVM